MSWIDPNSKMRDLLKTAEAIVAEDKKREFAAAEVVRVAAELKAKQEAEAKAAEVLKAKQEAEAKAAAELKAKQEAEAKAATDLKAKQEAEAKAAALKKTTITCLKGKLVKRVTAVKPKCPAGYKKK
jgi:membrane protein involved in colicin uptake